MLWVCLVCWLSLWVRCNLSVYLARRTSSEKSWFFSDFILAIECFWVLVRFVDVLSVFRKFQHSQSPYPLVGIWLFPTTVIFHSINEHFFKRKGTLQKAFANLPGLDCLIFSTILGFWLVRTSYIIFILFTNNL